MTKRKFKHVLTPYMVQDGMQPLDVLMAATRFYLDKGDVQSAVRVAETAAQYRHPRFQAVAVQGQLFELDESGNLAVSCGQASKATPALRISWNDEPEVGEIPDTPLMPPAHADIADTDAKPTSAAQRAARISGLERELQEAERAYAAQQPLPTTPPKEDPQS